MSNKATKLTVSGRTVNLLKADGGVLSTITTQDTNTWRGVINNLTSTSTTDGLSANMGRALASQIKTWKGNFARTGSGNTVPAHIVSRIYDNYSKADIQISCYFEVWKVNTGTEKYEVFNYDALKSVCGGKNVTITPEKTSVSLFKPGANPVDATYFGRSGLAFYATPSNRDCAFSRAYNSAMGYGGWGDRITVYEKGRYAIINVIGAVLS